jgi:O-antigen ligase
MDLIQLSKPKKIIFLGFLFLVFFTCTTFIINIPVVEARIEQASLDIIQLLNGNFNTSIGTRIAMWIISFQYLIPDAGFLGIGEMGVKVLVSSFSIDPLRYSGAIYHLSNTGPHSDFLAKLLSLGYLGGVAYLFTVLIPMFLFLKTIGHINKKKSEASQIGLYYILGIMICGLSNEMLSLKYLCSFYGLMIACLTADVLRDNLHTTEFNGEAV